MKLHNSSAPRAMARRALLSFGLLCAAWLPSLAQAQSYPARAVKFIVPFPPGGAIDALARLVGQRLGAAWSQPVIVENRPGAGGTIGTEMLAKAPADGYTLGWGAISTHGMNAVLYSKLGYDTLADFVPVASAAEVPNVLIVSPALQAHSVQDLVRVARANPGSLMYASAGGGSTLHISCELFKRLAKVEMVHVPYKGSAPALTDVMGGQVPVMCDSLTSALPHIRAGKVRAIGVTSARRSPLLPNTPTVAESGVPDYEMNPWYGVFAPAGTPAAVVARVNADINKILAMPEVKDRLATMGAEPLPQSPEQFSAMVRRDMARWGRLIKDMGITAE